jgi:hypothetical protein
MEPANGNLRLLTFAGLALALSAYPACFGQIVIGGAEPSSDGGADDAPSSSNPAIEEGGGSVGTSSTSLVCPPPPFQGAGVLGSNVTGETPITLATVYIADWVPGAMVTDGTNFYVAPQDDGPVVMAPLGGGAATVLNQGSTLTLANNSSSVFSVSWGTAPGGLVLSCARGGCNDQPVTLASGQTGIWGIAADDEAAYWTTGTSLGVEKVALAGGAPVRLAANESNGIAVHGDSVYFADANSGALMQVPKAGGPTTLLAGPPNPGEAVRWITADARNVYFSTTAGAVYQLSLCGGQQPQALYPPRDSGVGAPAVAVDQDYVYWLDSQTQFAYVLKSPIGGGAITNLASGAWAAGGIAVDATSVYWTTLATGVPDGDVVQQGTETFAVVKVAK